MKTLMLTVLRDQAELEAERRGIEDWTQIMSLVEAQNYRDVDYILAPGHHWNPLNHDLVAILEWAKQNNWNDVTKEQTDESSK